MWGSFVGKSVQLELRDSFDVRDLGSGGVRDSKSESSNAVRESGAMESRDLKGLRAVQDSGLGKSRVEESRIAEN